MNLIHLFGIFGNWIFLVSAISESSWSVRNDDVVDVLLIYQIQQKTYRSWNMSDAIIEYVRLFEESILTDRLRLSILAFDQDDNPRLLYRLGELNSVEKLARARESIQELSDRRRRYRTDLTKLLATYSRTIRSEHNRLEIPDLVIPLLSLNGDQSIDDFSAYERCVGSPLCAVISWNKSIDIFRLVDSGTYAKIQLFRVADHHHVARVLFRETGALLRRCPLLVNESDCYIDPGHGRCVRTVDFTPRVTAQVNYQLCWFRRPEVQPCPEPDRCRRRCQADDLWSTCVKGQHRFRQLRSNNRDCLALWNYTTAESCLVGQQQQLRVMMQMEVPGSTPSAPPQSDQKDQKDKLATKSWVETELCLARWMLISGAGVGMVLILLMVFCIAVLKSKLRSREKENKRLRDIYSYHSGAGDSSQTGDPHCGDGQFDDPRSKGDPYRKLGGNADRPRYLKAAPSSRLTSANSCTDEKSADPRDRYRQTNRSNNQPTYGRYGRDSSTVKSRSQPLFKHGSQQMSTGGGHSQPIKSFVSDSQNPPTVKTQQSHPSGPGGVPWSVQTPPSLTSTPFDKLMQKDDRNGGAGASYNPDECRLPNVVVLEPNRKNKKQKGSTVKRKQFDSESAHSRTGLSSGNR